MIAFNMDVQSLLIRSTTILFLCMILVTLSCKFLYKTPFSHTPTPTVSVSLNAPEIIIENTALSMAKLKTFKFKLEHKSRGTPLSENLVLTKIKGSIATPNKLHLYFSSISSDKYFLEGEVILINSDVYITNPINRQWIKVPEEMNTFDFFKPTEGLTRLLTENTGLIISDTETNFIHLQTYIKATVLKAFFKTTSTETITASLKIERSTNYLTEITLEGKITPNESSGIIRTITFSSFNEPLVIEPPL